MSRNRITYYFVLILLTSCVGLIYYQSIVPETLVSVNETINSDLKKISPSDESCILCHKMEKSFSPYHDPKMIGCTSCHLGNASSKDKDTAHQDMVKIPGNLSDAKFTCGKCHAKELHNVQHSLMTTNSGIVAIDKYVFGETKSPDIHYHIKDIQHSAADEHLRQLCANCHLGKEKNTFGSISELSRGGGCNACHLNYSEEAQENLYQYKIGKINVPTIHPSTDIHMTNLHCYGCHSRSSRISTNYMGLHETLKEEGEVMDSSNYTISQDGRVYSHQQADVHHSKGLLCIDCHTSQEVMGDGKDYLHEEDAVKLQCSDCHYKDTPNTTSFDVMDSESKLVFMVRNYLHNDKPIIYTENEKMALVNTFVDENNKAFLISKKDSSIHPIVPQGDCRKDVVHSDLTCSACHTSWAPRCIACHTEYESNEKGFDLLDKKEVNGKWVEYVDGFHFGPPSLGVKYGDDKMEIMPAVPGMIMTLDPSGLEQKSKDQFHRLYAPNAPHTVQKYARDCKSCHSDPITLGYGEGSLTYIIDSSISSNGQHKIGFWRFEPSYELLKEDNLPQDAWIGFLSRLDGQKVYSTRTDFRPFNFEEQKKILRVGACLECHKPDGKVMKESIEFGFEKQIQFLTSACSMPE